MAIIYVPNIGTSKYVKQILADLKAESEGRTVTLRDFAAHLYQWIDHPHKICKETVAFNQMDLIHLYTTLLPKPTEDDNTLVNSKWNVPRINHVRPKTSLNKCQRIKPYQTPFPTIRLSNWKSITRKTKTGKNTNHGGQTICYLLSQRVNREIKKSWDTAKAVLKAYLNYKLQPYNLMDLGKEQTKLKEHGRKRIKSYFFETIKSINL